MKPIFDDPQKMRQHIIDTAIPVFSENGYASTSVQSIADRAGISRGPFYYYFQNKADVYLHALKESIRIQTEKYRQIFGQNTHILDKIREDLQYCMKELKNGRQDITATWQEGMPAEAKDLISDFYRMLYELKVTSVRKAIDNGELKQNADPKLIVDMMFMLYEGIRAMDWELGMKVGSEEVDELIEFSVSQIKTKYGAL